MININQSELARLRVDLLKKVLYDIRKELEADGAVYTENMTDADLLAMDTQAVTQLQINTDIAQELRDGHYRGLAESTAKKIRRENRL